MLYFVVIIPKGRDWYDFIWYVSRQTPINFSLLNHAIEQAGPWEKQNISVTPKWFLQELKTKINNMDWNMQNKMSLRFLRPRELATLELWSKDFFLSCLEKLTEYLVER